MSPKRNTLDTIPALTPEREEIALRRGKFGELEVHSRRILA